LSQSILTNNIFLNNVNNINITPRHLSVPAFVSADSTIQCCRNRRHFCQQTHWGWDSAVPAFSGFVYVFILL